jgi:hypothetical protein
VGSRLGKHAVWTVALSAVITLLALAPAILPGDRPLASLPPPLSGVAKVGDVVASALAPGKHKSEPASAQSSASAPTASASDGRGGVLAEDADGSKSPPADRKPHPKGGSPGKADDTKQDEQPPASADDGEVDEPTVQGFWGPPKARRPTRQVGQEHHHELTTEHPGAKHSERSDDDPDGRPEDRSVHGSEHPPSHAGQEHGSTYGPGHAPGHEHTAQPRGPEATKRGKKG